MCLRPPDTSVGAAELQVENARGALRAADGVEWVSDAADRFRASLAEATEAAARVTWALGQSLPAVTALHVAVEDATARDPLAVLTGGGLFDVGGGSGFAAQVVPW